MKKLEPPYPEELHRIARRVIWWSGPERSLDGGLHVFLAYLLDRGTADDIEAVRGYVGDEGFRDMLENAPPGVMRQEIWDAWRERLGLEKQPLPRRRFADGTLGPPNGGWFGR